MFQSELNKKNPFTATAECNSISAVCTQFRARTHKRQDSRHSAEYRIHLRVTLFRSCFVASNRPWSNIVGNLAINKFRLPQSWAPLDMNGNPLRDHIMLGGRICCAILVYRMVWETFAFPSIILSGERVFEWTGTILRTWQKNIHWREVCTRNLFYRTWTYSICGLEIDMTDQPDISWRVHWVYVRWIFWWLNWPTIDDDVGPFWHQCRMLTSFVHNTSINVCLCVAYVLLFPLSCCAPFKTSCSPFPHYFRPLSVVFFFLFLLYCYFTLVASILFLRTVRYGFVV